MKISVSRKTYPREFRRRVKIARTKRLSVEIDEDWRSLTAVVRSRSMVVGKFQFKKIIGPDIVDEELKLVRYNIFDKSAYPYEWLLIELTKRLKSSRIKSVNLNKRRRKAPL